MISNEIKRKYSNLSVAFNAIDNARDHGQGLLVIMREDDLRGVLGNAFDEALNSLQQEHVLLRGFAVMDRGSHCLIGDTFSIKRDDIAETVLNQWDAWISVDEEMIVPTVRFMDGPK